METFCTQCGTALVEGEGFCSGCGAAVRAAPAPLAAAVPQDASPPRRPRRWPAWLAALVIAFVLGLWFGRRFTVQIQFCPVATQEAPAPTT